MFPSQYYSENQNSRIAPQNWILFAQLNEISKLYKLHYESLAQNSQDHSSISTPKKEDYKEDYQKDIETSPVKSEYQENICDTIPAIKEESVDSPASPSVQSSEKSAQISTQVKSLQYETHYGRAILESFAGQESAFVTFYPGYAAQDEIREAELQEMAESFAKDGKVEKRTCIKSSFVKNFSKLNGDHFVNYVASKYKTESFKKVFKDKSSCLKFSEYLDGTRSIEGLDVKAFIRMYFEYIEETDTKEVDKSKVGSKSLRTCYKLIFNYLKAVVQALREWGVYEKVYSVQIEKFWPTVEITVKF